MEKLKIKFDKLTSHDITFCRNYSDRARIGVDEVPDSLCSDQLPQLPCVRSAERSMRTIIYSGLTCAKKYGGVYVPPHQAVIHQFAREMLAGGGKMILALIPTPLWCAGNDGDGRGRSGAGKAAVEPDL